MYMYVTIIYTYLYIVLSDSVFSLREHWSLFSPGKLVVLRAPSSVTDQAL